ncbi:MAG: hypothetical protein A3J54_01215 [Candidatus Ryanbacteria bacterium RIFCSPHIGHO2_02_FULL_45_13b]|uniref:Peptidoglycan binding-like domain-containing protein n=1 Tax=Candidatus Ryanbacteria bacterium RIFCSPHIGHO2_02_FULL_45_13b TaxID=1802117 RepID=A0A1G2G9R4_9BACT|nr:MAG: hypothetical protein A3J54_01215 [Candidatus Ryanbacteria bacterium RIFCSPHIGHO2_02_FULL_45_13b]
MRFVLFLFITLFLIPRTLYAAEPFGRDLSWGLRNDADVRRLQIYLRDEGLYAYPEITGNYFSVTKAAVTAFQKAQRIRPADGAVSGKTRIRFNEVYKPKVSSTVVSSPIFLRDLSYGLRADLDVARLQDFLRDKGLFTHSESTGNYFTVTADAVTQYQFEKKIPQSGSFDTLTRAYVNLDILASASVTADASTQVLPAPTIATSTFYKLIDISIFSGKNTNPLSERVTLTNRSKSESISVTGWEFETSLGTRFIIPSAYNLPGVLDALLGPIVLPPGGKLRITVGKQEKYSAFRENICTGYFVEQTKFTPSISKQCPETDSFDLLYLGDKCIATIDKVPRCTIPTETHFFAQSSECSSYMIQNLSYAGCVRNNRNKEDFYKNEWFVWLNRDTEIFRNIHETLTLYDIGGKFVDSREY